MGAAGSLVAIKAYMEFRSKGFNSPWPPPVKETYKQEIEFYKDRLEGPLSLVSMTTYSQALIYYLKKIPIEEHPSIWTKEELKESFNYKTNDAFPSFLDQVTTLNKYWQEALDGSEL